MMTLSEIKGRCLNPEKADRVGKSVLHKDTRALLEHKDVSSNDIYLLFRSCPTKTAKRLLAEELLANHRLPSKKLVYLSLQPVTKTLGLKAFTELLSRKNISINNIRGISKRSIFKVVRIAAQKALLLHPSVLDEDRRYLVRRGENEEVKILAGKNLPEYMH
jgi:hypothetical protein